MRALTLWQPWASLCVLPRPCPVAAADDSETCEHDEHLPFKTIETRSWPAPKALIGQRIAIHAAKRFIDNDGITLLNEADWPISIPELPLGAVVGTAVLTDCVPMIDSRAKWDGTGLVLDVEHRWLYDPTSTAGGRDVCDQLPFGDFRPGRWAWLLADAEAFVEPIPAVGRQGVWRWEP